MNRETGKTGKLDGLAEKLNSLEAANVSYALFDMHENGIPSTAQQAVQLRNSDAVPTLIMLLEPPYDVTLRSQALHVIARMCKLDPMSQDSFINHGVVRKLIRNAETGQGASVDATAAVRALTSLIGGADTAAPSQLAVVEDVIHSGLLARKLVDASAHRRKPDDPLVVSIAEFLAIAATRPANHIKLRDAGLTPLLPTLLSAGGSGAAASADGGGAAATAFLDYLYHLSTSDAAAPSLRTEALFDALTSVLSAAPAMSTARRTALLTLCNVYGADADNVRAEEVLRDNGVPPLLTALLAAALGPADVGSAARATGAVPAGPVAAAAAGSGGMGMQHRRSGGLAAAGGATAGRVMRVSDGGALGRVAIGGRVSGSGGAAAAADGAAAGATALGRPRHSDASSRGWQVRTMPEQSGAAAGGGRREAGIGYGLSSITMPGFSGGGGGAGHQTPKAPGDGATGVGEPPPVPLEHVLHSLKCMAANPMLARKLAKPGSPAYVLPSLLDAVVSSLQHAAAGAISRAAGSARTAAGAQTLLRMSQCAELVPALRAAGTAAVLRLLALEAEDSRVGEAACGALLYMGDTGPVGYTSRPAAAAFRALYRNGIAPAGSEPELGNRFQVFVSHHRADAHQFALCTLYPMLVLQGVPAFVDPQHRTASSDWAHMIACCRNMVVVVSEMLLASPEHVREAEAAVAAGVNLVAVLPEGARWSDSHGNKAFDSPPPAVLLALPACLRGLLTENVLPYSGARHGEFTQQLMARLQLPAAAAPPPADDPAETSSPAVSPGREAARLRAGGASGSGGEAGGGGAGCGGSAGCVNGRDASRGRGRWTGKGDPQGADDQPPHRVSFSGVGDDFQRLQQQQDDEERAELAAAEATTGAAAAADIGLGPLPGQPPPQLPWPWNRLLDGATTLGSDDEEETLPVRYPRTLYGNGLGGGGDPLSGSAMRESATGMAAPPAVGGPASYTSRRFTARQRSSINRHVALQLQQQQQMFLVQQQWLQEYQNQVQRKQQQLQQLQQQQQQTSVLLGSHGSGGPAAAAAAAAAASEDGSARATCAGSVRGGGGAVGDLATICPAMLNQLLALQLEMVRYEVRQAVQASHDNITYKIDRLRSDVTEQVVQLRFDLAGKIEALQETLTKVAAASGGGGAPPREAVDAASGATAAGSGGSGGSSREPGGAASPFPSQQQLQHQQLAAALSSSLAASLQDAINRAVLQLQATAAAGAGLPVKLPAAAVPVPAAPAPGTAVGYGGSGPGPLPKGHQGATAMLAAAAAQQQQQLQQQQGAFLIPHLPPQPSNHARASATAAVAGGGGGVTVAAPPTQALEILSPVARAGAAAWSGDGVPAATANVALGHGGGSKSRSSHPGYANGTLPAGGGKGGGGGAGTGAAARPGPLTMLNATATAEDEAGGGGGAGMDGRVMSPTALLATFTGPATAQAAVLLAGRSRAYMGTTAQGVGGAGGVSQKERNGLVIGAVAAGGASAGGGKGTLPPLAGLLPSFAPTAGGKLVERTEAQPVRKAQQQQLLLQQ